MAVIPLIATAGAAAVAGVLLLRARRRARVAQTVAALRAAWGRAQDRPRDLDACRAFAVLSADPATPRLDEHTWRDLDMDQVYAAVDRTQSSPGQLVLYRWLRETAPDERALQRRDRTIRVFQEDPHARETVQIALDGLGMGAHASEVVALLWGSEDPEVPPHRMLTAMAALAVVALTSPWWLGPAGWPLLVVVFAVNHFLHARAQIRYGPEILGLRYLGAVLGVAGTLARSRLPALEEHTRVLAEHHRAARPVARAVTFFPGGGAQDLLYEYLNILFLLEARALSRALGAVRDPALRAAFLAVGELDAAQAVASFRQGLPYSCAPELTTDGLTLDVEDVFHPLLPAPVPNSIALAARGTLITGSNMSGKSTFLRALGINAILAQTIHTAAARRYRARRLRVLSSMRSTDDVVEGKSAYWAEAERLLVIIRSLDATEPVLCLIDEILAGTNSAERRAASIEILQFVAREGALLVATTHDVELTVALASALDCHHFDGEASERGMRFDHRLRPGVSRRGQAIALLGVLGFPAAIVAGARRRVAEETPGGAGG